MKTRYLRLLKKQRGFTLIELLAVILILGVIALIAIPTVSTVVNTAKENAMINTGIAIAKKIEDECTLQLLKGEKIKENYIIMNGVLDVDVKGVPDNGVIKVDDKCNASVIITDNKYCVTGTVDEMVISSDLSKCENDIIAAGGTISNGGSNNGGNNGNQGNQGQEDATVTKSSCFVFDTNSRTITGYKYDDATCPMDVVIPNTINNVPVEHIGEEAFYRHRDNEIIMYHNFYNSDNKLENIIETPYETSYIHYANDGNAKKYCYNIELNDYELVSLNFIIDSNYSDCYFENVNQLSHGISITSVSFEKALNLKTIEDNAFENTDLSTIKFGNNTNLTKIGSAAFANTLLTGTIDLSSTGVSEMGGFIFYENGINNIIFSNTLKEIPIYALAYNAIENIDFGNGVETAGPSSFASNNLTNLIIPNSVKTISDYAFENNQLLTSVTLHSGLDIGKGAFYYNGITSVNIPNNSTVGSYAFTYNPITTLTIGSNVTLSNGSFYKMTGAVNTLILPGDIKEIPNYLFTYTKINDLVLKDGVEKVGQYAFEYSDLKSVTIPSSVKLISNYAFDSNASLTTVNLPKGVEILSYAFANSGITKFSVPDHSTIGGYVLYSNPVTSITIGENTSLAAGAFRDMKGTIDTVTILGDIKKVSASLFRNTRINNLILEDGIEEIDNYAFSGSYVKTIKWSNTLKRLGAGSFVYAGIKTIDLPSSLETIEYSVFQGMSAKDITMTIPASVKSIGTQVFFNTNFKEVYIESGNTKINSSSFFCSKEASCGYTININAKEGDIANAPWGNTYATINYLQ